MGGPLCQSIENLLNLFTGSQRKEEPFEVQVCKLANEIFESVVLGHEVTDGCKFNNQHEVIPKSANAIQDWVLPPLSDNLQLYLMIVFLLHIFLHVGELVKMLNEIFTVALPFSLQIFFYPAVIISIIILIEML